MHLRLSRDDIGRVSRSNTQLFCALLATAVLSGCGGGSGGPGTADSGAGAGADSSSGGAAHSSSSIGMSIERSTVLQAPSQPPKLRQWERNMVSYGQQWGDALLSESDYLQKFKLRYYDGQRVHEQIAAYLGENQPWRSYSQEAESTYKKYLENADFRAQGWQRFPHGLYLDWKRTGDSQSRDYLKPLRDKPPFSNPLTNSYADEWASQRYSREVAYAIQSQLIAERAGYERETRTLAKLVNLALGHIDIWVTQKYVNSNSTWHYTQPFMAGLTASALISHYERSVELDSPDSRILPAIERLAEFLWNETWVASVNGTGYGAFVYKNTSDSPAPDLNQLIAPMFAWLYYQTGEHRWLQRGDKIFAGGVVLADLNSGKRFNQQYRSSFRYVGWRTRAVLRYGS